MYLFLDSNPDQTILFADLISGFDVKQRSLIQRFRCKSYSTRQFPFKAVFVVEVFLSEL